jgi:hypothetical protein
MHRMPFRHTKLRYAAALTALLGLVLAACGGEDAADPAPEPAAAETAVDDTSAGDDGDVVEVSLHDYAFAGLPGTVAAGTRFTVVNESDDELHELVAFLLPDEEDRSVEELTTLSPGELVGSLGEPVTVLLAEPGGPTIPAVGDGTLAETGRYAIMCFIPTGADPQEYLRVAAETEEGPPQVDGGPPHFVQGMFAELTVN